MAQNIERDNSRPLTLQELWECWPEVLAPERVRLGDRTALTERQLTPPSLIKLEAIQQLLNGNILNMHDGSHVRAFPEAWQEFHDTTEQDVTVEQKIIMANEIKEEGNSEYKNRHFRYAIYIYCKAWMCMLPYHCDAFPVGDSRRIELAKMENILFDNIMTVILDNAKDTTHDIISQKGLYVHGYSLGLSFISQSFACTVKSLKTAIRKLREINDKLKSYNERNLQTLTEEMLSTLDAQELYCKGKPDDYKLIHMDPKLSNQQAKLLELSQR